MDKQPRINDDIRLPNPKLDLGQQVRILYGEHRGVSGRVVACEWNSDRSDWIYFVKHAQAEFGPYITQELW